MKIYSGRCDDKTETVTVDGAPLDPQFDLAMHSPSGFSWGYGGSGPAQLAIAILADCIGPDEARCFYQDFKWQIVCKWELREPWTIAETAIRAWLDQARKELDRYLIAEQFDADRDDHPLED
jgi:hypothetical protein